MQSDSGPEPLCMAVMAMRLQEWMHVIAWRSVWPPISKHSSRLIDTVVNKGVWCLISYFHSLDQRKTSFASFSALLIVFRLWDAPMLQTCAALTCNNRWSRDYLSKIVVLSKVLSLQYYPSAILHGLVSQWWWHPFESGWSSLRRPYLQLRGNKIGLILLSHGTRSEDI